MTRKSKVDVLSIACPSCEAPIGARCWSGTRRLRRLVRGAHVNRVRAAQGIPVPESFQTYLKRELRRVTAEVVAKHGRKP